MDFGISRHQRNVISSLRVFEKGLDPSKGKNNPAFVIGGFFARYLMTRSLETIGLWSLTNVTQFLFIGIFGSEEWGQL